LGNYWGEVEWRLAEEGKRMSEQQQYDSPLVGERGSTTISDTVVATIAGRAAQEVEGVHMGGSASRAAGGILGSISGSESQTRGVSVEVGQVEAAIDLTMGVEYGRDIMQTVEEVRRRISDRVQSLTGLHVTELNATISDIVFPERGGRRRALEDGTETRPLPSAGERETTEEGTSGPLSEEEVRVEGEPLAEDETAELKPGEDETRSSEER
jgi:uncharacterized alkaline shock family protein YloU